MVSADYSGQTRDQIMDGCISEVTALLDTFDTATTIEEKTGDKYGT